MILHISDTVGEIFLNKLKNPCSPHLQPLSQLWERGADYGKIRGSRIRQQYLYLDLTPINSILAYESFCSRLEYLYRTYPFSYQ